MENENIFPEDRFVVYEKLAKANFNFLTEYYGFQLSNIEKIDDRYISLKYLSGKVFFNLYYGSPGFDLDFNIGRVGIDDKHDNKGFTSGDLVLLGDNVKWESYKLYSAHSYENLRKGLPKLADLLKEFGDSLLKGNSSFYEKIIFEKNKNQY